MGVIQRFFSWLANGIMRMLLALQEWVIQDGLKITPPTERTQIVSGYAYNLEIFPVLFAMTILIGLISLPFARERVTMDLFILKMIKVFLFVIFIGVILTLAVELNNALIEYLWPAGSYQDLQVELNATLNGMAAGGLMLVAVIGLGSISFLTYLIFFMAIFLREFFVNALYILAPLLGAFLFLDFGPFKATSRMPKILIRATAYLLIAGVIAAGFAQVGIAIGGGFAEENVESATALEDLSVDDISELEVQSQIAQAPGPSAGFRGLDPEIVGGEAANISANPALLRSKTDSFTRGSPSQYKDTHAIYDHDALSGYDEMRVERARFVCGAGLRNSVANQYTGSQGGLNNGRMGPVYQPAEPVEKYYQIASEWAQSQKKSNGEAAVDDLVSGCMVPVLEAGIGGWGDHPDVQRISPISPAQAIKKCGQTTTRQTNYGTVVTESPSADTAEFIENNRQCIREEEEKLVGDYDEWRNDPDRPGAVYFWFNHLPSLEDPGAISRAWNNLKDAGAGFANTITLGGYGAAKDIYGATFGGGDNPYHASFSMVGDSAYSQCDVGAEGFRCLPQSQFEDGLEMFLLWFMSFISPIIIIFYSGYAAIGPSGVLMGAMGGGAAAANKTTPSRTEAGGGGADSSSVLRRSTRDGFSGGDPIGTGQDGDHLSVDTTGQVSRDDVSSLDSDPIQPQDSGLNASDAIVGAASRGSAGAKQTINQGLAGSPLNWAKSTKHHFDENQIGDPPNSNPSPLEENMSELSNEEILDHYDDYDEELPAVEAQDIQDPETEEGMPVNLEGTWTFTEAENDPPDGGQAGTLVQRTENGEHRQIPWTSDDAGQAGLEAGEEYEINGVVTRKSDAQHQRVEGQGADLERTDWEGDYMEITPGRNSDIKKVEPGGSSGENSGESDGSSGGDSSPPGGEVESSTSVQPENETTQETNVTQQQTSSTTHASVQGGSNREQIASSSAESGGGDRSKTSSAQQSAEVSSSRAADSQVNAGGGGEDKLNSQSQSQTETQSESQSRSQSTPSAESQTETGVQHDQINSGKNTKQSSASSMSSSDRPEATGRNSVTTVSEAGDASDENPLMKDEEQSTPVDPPSDADQLKGSQSNIEGQDQISPRTVDSSTGGSENTSAHASQSVPPKDVREHWGKEDTASRESRVEPVEDDHIPIENGGELESRHASDLEDTPKKMGEETVNEEVTSDSEIDG